MPGSFQGDCNWFERRYNEVFGTAAYQQYIRPYLDKYLGGSVSLFLDQPIFADASYTREKNRNEIDVDISLPQGSSLQQMDELVRRLERLAQGYSRLKECRATINSAEDATVSLFIKAGYENSSFPYFLKNRMETEAAYIGSADFRIAGIGLGFDNTIYKRTTTYRISLLGYNYDKLQRIAGSLWRDLSGHTRVSDLHMKSDGSTGGREKKRDDPVFSFLNGKGFADIRGVNGAFPDLPTGPEYITQVPEKGTWVPVTACPEPMEKMDLWKLMNYALMKDTASYIRLKDLVKISRGGKTDGILRFNQQYRIFIEYNFIGEPSLGNRITKGCVDKVKESLPLGYSINQESDGLWNNSGKGLISGIFISLLVIFFISGIFLNSIYQALLVVAVIPVSFIGIFITSFLFKFNFDEGGYASFIVLSGIVVNWVLFILNDFNKFPTGKGMTMKRAYIKAFDYKVTPILLSAISNILGLLPFIIYNRHEKFWYAFSICSVGGVVFSVVMTLLLLPVFLKLQPSRQ